MEIKITKSKEGISVSVNGGIYLRDYKTEKEFEAARVFLFQHGLLRIERSRSVNFHIYDGKVEFPTIEKATEFIVKSTIF